MGLRLVAILGLGLLTGACTNMVYSERPLFEGQTAAEGLHFRAGLWAAPDKGCRFNPARPLAAWPKCANGQAFDDTGPVGVSPTENVSAFADGEVVIFQTETRDRKPADHPDASDLPFSYSAMGGLRRDADGRIVRFQEWFVQCGPPHSAKPAGTRFRTAPATEITRHPFPGLTIIGENCVATEAASVRHAARSSRRLGASTARWMRDGDS